MTEPNRKPFWKRKRWIAAAGLWLVVAYPLSGGPAICAARLGWIPVSLVTAFAPPAVQQAPIVGSLYRRYLLWWWNLAPGPDGEL